MATSTDVPLFGLVCACASLRRLSRLVTRLYDDELRPCGLEAPQFGLLNIITRLGEASHRQLADGLAIDGTTLTRTLGLMQRRGWIAKRPGADRRSRVYRVTARGARKLAEARPRWQDARRKLEAMVGEQPLDTVLSVAHEASVKIAATGSGAFRAQGLGPKA